MTRLRDANLKRLLLADGRDMTFLDGSKRAAKWLAIAVYTFFLGSMLLQSLGTQPWSMQLLQTLMMLPFLCAGATIASIYAGIAFGPIAPYSFFSAFQKLDREIASHLSSGFYCPKDGAPFSLDIGHYLTAPGTLAVFALLVFLLARRRLPIAALMAFVLIGSVTWQLHLHHQQGLVRALPQSSSSCT